MPAWPQAAVAVAAAGAAAAANRKVAAGTSEETPEELPDLVLRGIEEFNRGEFFECHEYLEEAWMQESGRVRYLYQGILQVGVGFYHLQNGNWRGATGLLRNGTTRLKEFEPAALGVDVAKLISQSENCLRQLETLGRERIEEFDQSEIPKVEYEK